MAGLRLDALPHYIVKDYECWEGDWELIEGIPYSMSPAPTIAHQTISQKISGQLFQHLLECQRCQALLPVDWKIAEDTVVQPDNIVVCHDVSGQYLTQAPSMIFEILSPATAKKDEGIKFELYEREGVPYYIIVNPDTSVAKIYQLTDDGRLIKKKDAKNDSFHFSVEGCEFTFDFSVIW